VPDDELHDLAAEGAGGGDAGRYEPPELSVYEGDTQVAWAYDRAGGSPPDDTLGAAPESSEAPKVLGWTAPRPDYSFDEPALFAAPANPKRRVSPPKREFTKTTHEGKTTLTRATKTRLTGQDAFGGTLCTCDLVCTCNLVCTCQAVATCNCVDHTASGGGTTPPCGSDTVCACDTECALDGSCLGH
jgi:hypothetical protein